MNRYLITYDIAHPRRLRRVATQLEKQAIRLQKSVFMFFGPATQMSGLFGNLINLADSTEDRIQVWRIASAQDNEGLYAFGTVVPFLQTNSFFDG